MPASDELGNYTDARANFSSPCLGKSRLITPPSADATASTCAIRTSRWHQKRQGGSLPRWTTCGSTRVRATGTRQRNGEAGAASREADADHTWLVGLHFRNANPDTAADLVLRLALAVRPKHQRGLAEFQKAPVRSYFCSPRKAGASSRRSMSLSKIVQTSSVVQHLVCTRSSDVGGADRLAASRPRRPPSARDRFEQDRWPGVGVRLIAIVFAGWERAACVDLFRRVDCGPGRLDSAPAARCALVARGRIASAAGPVRRSSCAIFHARRDRERNRLAVAAR